MPTSKKNIENAANTLSEIIDQNSADNTKLAKKLNSVAEAAIDAIVHVMQDSGETGALKLQAAQTLLKTRQEVTERLAKDAERQKENSFSVFD